MTGGVGIEQQDDAPPAFEEEVAAFDLARRLQSEIGGEVDTGAGEAELDERHGLNSRLVKQADDRGAKRREVRLRVLLVFVGAALAFGAALLRSAFGGP